MKRLLVASILGCGLVVARAAEPPRTWSDDFTHGLDAWAVEQQPGGTVTAMDNVLRIDDRGGCTVWFRPRLTAPVVISYEARMLSTGRVSDLNCFWMASDPAHPGDLLAHRRDGKFASYDSLLTYYVGVGGNNNTTTRFRRYDGTGARPLAPEFDHRDRADLLDGDRTYRIRIVVAGDGHVQFLRDDKLLFDFRDPKPLLAGWFGFRTVQSRIEIRHFRVEESSGSAISH
ncbi:MAG TPA: DUF6250 domain-containing protein [Candidatus Didemnitutus sp.]|nr:DUF6250 domain-containing protein [Candidatus Didemnitutus sp.]